MEWFPRNPSDYRDATWHLTLAEHGAYGLLIDYYMMHEKAIPNNDNAIASIIGVSPESWLEVKENVMPFFKEKSGRLFHKRCDDELKSAFKKRKDGAKRAEKYRKNGGECVSDDEVTQDECDTNASRGDDRTLEDKDGPPKKPKRKSAMTTKWTLPIEDKEWAEKTVNENNLTINCSVEVEKFRDYHLGKGSIQLDWSATWRTWVRNFIKWAKEKNPDLTGTLSHEAQKQIRKDAELKYGGKANG